MTSAPRIVGLDAFTGGGAQNDHSRTEHHFKLTDIVSWSTGRHALKFGFQIPDWSRRRFDDNTNTVGTFLLLDPRGLHGEQAVLVHPAAGERPHRISRKGPRRLPAGRDSNAFERHAVGRTALRWQNYFHDNNNVAPRASIAFSPTESGRTVIRSGIGIDPGYPIPGVAIAAEPASIVRFGQDIVIPSWLQYGVSAERQLRKGTSASITYTATRAHNQFLSRDVNAPAPPLYLARPDAAFGVRFDFADDQRHRHRFDFIGTLNSGSWANLGIAVGVYSGRPYSMTTGHDDFNTGTANARPAASRVTASTVLGTRMSICVGRTRFRCRRRVARLQLLQVRRHADVPVLRTGDLRTSTEARAGVGAGQVLRR